MATGSGGGNTPQVMKDCGFEKVILEEQVEFLILIKALYGVATKSP